MESLVLRSLSVCAFCQSGALQREMTRQNPSNLGGVSSMTRRGSLSKPDKPDKWGLVLGSVFPVFPSFWEHFFMFRWVHHGSPGRPSIDSAPGYKLTRTCVLWPLWASTGRGGWPTWGWLSDRPDVQQRLSCYMSRDHFTTILLCTVLRKHYSKISKISKHIGARRSTSRLFFLQKKRVRPPSIMPDMQGCPSNLCLVLSMSEFLLSRSHQVGDSHLKAPSQSLVSTCFDTSQWVLNTMFCAVLRH